ncbi:hypothetical protein [uncultured Nostoc sp.]
MNLSDRFFSWRLGGSLKRAIAMLLHKPQLKLAILSKASQGKGNELSL